MLQHVSSFVEPEGWIKSWINVETNSIYFYHFFSLLLSVYLKKTFSYLIEQQSLLRSIHTSVNVCVCVCVCVKMITLCQ